MIMRRATTLSPLWRRKISSSSSPTINNRNIFPSISTLSSSSATLINQQQQQPAVSFVSAVKSRSYHHSTHHHQQRFSSWEYYSALTAAAATAASAVLLATTTSFSTTTTRCDDDDDNNSNNNKSNEIETDTEIDPYDNLPEKDEPTNCSICLTYRQGPCRPYWRKVEACTKENEEKIKQEEKEEEDSKKEYNDKNNEEEEDQRSSDPKCFKYMMPWIDCASRYRNLYNLIEMDMNFTEGVKDLEATSLHFDWSSGMEPNIDWTNYKSHVLLADTDDGDASESSESNSNKESQAQLPQLSSSPNYATGTTTATTLWKTFDTTLGDPELITVEAKVPATMGGGILECAYALDQHNNVIGFAYGTNLVMQLQYNNSNKLMKKMIIRMRWRWRWFHWVSNLLLHGQNMLLWPHRILILLLLVTKKRKIMALNHICTNHNPYSWT